MEKESIIKNMRFHITQGVRKQDLKLRPLLANLSKEDFEYCYLVAKKPLQDEMAKQRKKKLKNFEKTISVRLPTKIYDKLMNVFDNQVTITSCKSNRGKFYRDFIIKSLENKYRELGLDWENN